MRIKKKISLAGGVTTLIAVAAITLFSVVQMKGMHQGIEQRISKSMLSSANQALDYRLQAGASNVGQLLNASMQFSEQLAQSAASLRVSAPDPKALRHQYTQIMQDNLQVHENLLGVYMAWEPNVLDAADAEFAGRSQQGYDSTGRYIPYYTRDQGKISVSALVDYENTERASADADRAGEYYLCSKDSGASCLLEPYTYSVNGIDTKLTSLVSPIMLDDKFAGIAGVDIALDKLDSLAQQISQDLYQGKSEVFILTSKGNVTGKSQNADVKGFNADSALHNDIVKRLNAGAGLTGESSNGEKIWAFTPISIMSGVHDWGVYIQVPKTVVLAELTAIQQFIAESSLSLIIGMLIMGLVLILAAIAVIWYFAQRISQPIKTIALFLAQVAQGDFTRRVQWSSKDETGDLAKACNEFLDQIQPVIQQVSHSSADINRQSQATKLVAEQALQGASQQQTELSALATAAEELGTTASNVAEHALEASQMTNASQQSANSGQQVLDNASAAVISLAENITQVADAVIALQQDSDNINSILDVIRTIADQTNLLALNAAIEAARAGEQGRGFAVVADEVRSLAQRTQDSTAQIQGMLEGLSKSATQASSLMMQSREQAGDSTQAMEETRGQLSEILSSVSNIHMINTQVASAAEQQIIVAQEISKNLAAISEISSSNAQGAEQANRSCDSLTQLSTTLTHQVGRFSA